MASEARTWSTFPGRQRSSCRPIALPWVLPDFVVEKIERLEAQLAARGATYAGWAYPAEGGVRVDALAPDGTTVWRWPGVTIVDALNNALRETRDA